MGAAACLGPFDQPTVWRAACDASAARERRLSGQARMPQAPAILPCLSALSPQIGQRWLDSPTSFQFRRASTRLLHRKTTNRRLLISGLFGTRRIFPQFSSIVLRGALLVNLFGLRALRVHLRTRIFTLYPSSLLLQVSRMGHGLTGREYRILLRGQRL